MHIPDPETQPDFYAGVTTKRALAWIVDVTLIFIITVIVATLPLFIGWFFLPLIFLSVSLFYRISQIAKHSATWGMRLFNIELRNHEGAHLEVTEAALHTVGYFIATAFFLPQLASIIMMIVGPRGQALHDLLTGCVMINKASRF